MPSARKGLNIPITFTWHYHVFKLLAQNIKCDMSYVASSAVFRSKKYAVMRSGKIEITFDTFRISIVCAKVLGL